MRLQCLVTILACSVSIACIAASEPAPLAYSPLAQTPSSNAVASAAPEATKAGMAIMEQGGNAFDAAVAVGKKVAERALKVELKKLFLIDQVINIMAASKH